MYHPYGSEFTRKLWTDLDHILLVYVGSAAEFSLVEENHWLFYTNKLPSAPLNRLISTCVWNRKVMTTSAEDVKALAKTIRGFHDQVERERDREEGGASENFQSGVPLGGRDAHRVRPAGRRLSGGS